MKIKAGTEAEYAVYIEMNSQDGYSKGVVTYAERWAETLEKRIPEGSTPAQVMSVIVEHAETDSHAADTQGITGFMYGCAVNALAHFWEHGEQLRRWHNKETQIGDEGDRANESGDVLNPALLCIAP